MATLKITKSLFRVLFICFLMASIKEVKAQEIKLSLGASVGYAPSITFGASENSGLVSGLFGELKYGQITGRLQYTKPMLGTFEENRNLDGGSAYHGSLGYQLDLNEKLSLNIMLSGGATVINYNNSFNANSGDEFINVSPQVGINLFPAYQISKQLSLQGGLRYYKGFEAGDRGRASDLMDIGLGLRFTL